MGQVASISRRERRQETDGSAIVIDDADHPLPIGVLIVAGVRMYREWLARALGDEDRIRVVGALADLSGPAADIAAMRPDVVVTELAGAGTLETASALRTVLPDLRIVALAVAEADCDLVACAAAGSRDSSPKTSPSRISWQPSKACPAGS